MVFRMGAAVLCLALCGSAALAQDAVAQTPDEVAPDAAEEFAPPAPIDQDPGEATADPPPPPADPAESAPPATDAPADPSRPDDQPAAPGGSAPPPADEPGDHRGDEGGYDTASGGIDWAVLGVQAAAGLGTSLVLNLPLGLAQSALSAIPGVNVAAPFVVLAVRYILTGTVITMVGDSMGDSRGVILWPALASALTGFVCGGLTSGVVIAIALVTVVLVGAGALGTLFALSNNPSLDIDTLTRVLIGLYAAYGIGLLTALGTGLVLGVASEVTAQTVGAYAYHLSAEPKFDDDDGGFRFPGVLQPNHPPGPGEGVPAEDTLPGADDRAPPDIAGAFSPLPKMAY